MTRDRLWIGLFVAVILAALVAGIAQIWPVLTMVSDPKRVTRNYYIPSESMLPTLRLNDRFRPRLVTTPSKGDVIVFRLDDGARVARVAGVAGDEVAMRAGHLIVNGRAVLLHAVGPGPRVNDTATVMFRERMIGETKQHFVLDAGPTPQDDVAPLRIPSGRLFVLGDNRDFAADSRIGTEQSGAGLVPVADVIGVVDRLLWSGGFHDLGRPIDTGAPR